MQSGPSFSEQIDILQLSKLRAAFLKGLNGQLGSEGVMQPDIPPDSNFEEKNSLSMEVKEGRVTVCRLILNTWYQGPHLLSQSVCISKAVPSWL